MIVKTKPREPSRPFVTVLRDWLAVVALVAGGAWAGIAFFYDRLIEPRLRPALVTLDGTVKVIESTACCHMVEVELTIQNRGKRDAYIHASHLVAGARQVAAPGKLAASAVQRLNLAILAQANTAFTGRDTTGTDWQHGAIRPLGSEYLIVALGNIVFPGTQLLPGASFSRKSVLLVPREYLVLSLRANLFVAHTPSLHPLMAWHWTANPEDLALQALPWPVDDATSLTELMHCIKGGVPQQPNLVLPRPNFDRPRSVSP